MSAGHSFLPPSGAAAWLKCPAWAQMQLDFPEEETEESREGVAAHWVFTEMLEGRAVSLDSIAPNGVQVSSEMLEGGELFASTVRAKIGDETPVNIEQKIACAEIHDICFGTPDVWAFRHTKRMGSEFFTLDIFEYKFGHAFVSEFENAQLVTYCAGIISAISEKIGEPFGQVDQATRVNFHIVQPRCYHKGAAVRSWSCRASDLRGFWNRLRAAADAATRPGAQALTNGECRHCSGRHACAALQKAAYSDAEFATSPARFDLTPQAASLELVMLERALARLQSRTEGLREVMLQHIRAGASVPHWSIESTKGRTVWNGSPELIATMGDLMGINLRKPALITPTQAVKLGIDEAVIKGYTSQQSGSLKLVPVDTTDARRAFGNN